MSSSMTIPWKLCLAQRKCDCRERRLEKQLLQKTKKKKKTRSNQTGVNEGLPLAYPNGGGLVNKTTRILDNSVRPKKNMRTFQIEYKENLSTSAKSVLSSFESKYIYYAIDDLLYILGSESKESQNLLELLYSSMLSLHNDYSINFFDIWIESVSINDIYKHNKFLTSKSQKLKSVTNITLQLSYIARLPIKKPEPIW